MIDKTMDDIADAALTRALQDKLDQKTKPTGSLGQLEALALQIGRILGTLSPQLVAPQLLVFAGDHGLVAQGVSAYPSDVTWQMVENFLSGGAAVSVLARQNGIALTVVDCGVRHDFLAPAGAPRPGLLVHKLGPGTQDSSRMAAMSAQQCAQGIDNGRAIVRQLPGNALLLGEMGIGNTSAASMLLSRLAGLDIARCTGAGTGLDAAAVARKSAILGAVLQRHAAACEPLDALAAFGGFELATMLGAVLQAAQDRRVILVDGFITSAVILIAHCLSPNVLRCCVFAHRSSEPGHRLLLERFGVQPLLDLGLRLGEGSGAALAWPLLQSACAILCGMASFASAGVSGRSDPV